MRDLHFQAPYMLHFMSHEDAAATSKSSRATEGEDTRMLWCSSRLYATIIRLQLSPLEAVGLVHVTKRLFIMTNNTAEKFVTPRKVKV
jgi:hypothetical protein